VFSLHTRKQLKEQTNHACTRMLPLFRVFVGIWAG
jgi:hypothetical protein